MCSALHKLLFASVIPLLFFFYIPNSVYAACCCCYIPDPFCSGSDCCSSYTCGSGDECCGAGGGGGCFLPNTQIATDSAGQTKSIEDLQVGDQVVGFDEQTGGIRPAQVAQIYEVQRDYYYNIETSSGDHVMVTAEHPFFVGFGNSKPGHFLTRVGLFFSHIYQSLQAVL